MKILCKIGIHDWEIINKKSAYDIRRNYNEIHNCNVEQIVEYPFFFFSNKVCMRCAKKSNGIEKYEFLLFQKERRYKIAIEKFNEK